MKIENWEIDDVKPYDRNPRNNAGAVDAVAESLEKFGFRQPIVVDKNGVVIVGHTRLKAARQIGMKSVPVHVADMDDVSAKAYRIADNQTATLADWDLSRLSLELQDLDDMGFDMSGFKFDEDLFSDANGTEGLTDPDDVPEPPKKAITKPGDLWLLGKHRLLCGDATKAEDVERLMDGQKADICFTSPPYNAGKSESLSGNTHTKDNKYIGGHDDDMEGRDWLSLIQSSLCISMKHSDFQFFNIQQLAGNKREVIDFLYANKNKFADVSIWNKQHAPPAMAENVMNSQFEYVFIFSSKENPSRAISTAQFRGTFSNVYDGSPQRNNEFSDKHAATFPVDFPLHYIESFSRSGCIVYEPFCGSGSTMIACEQTGRRCYGMELDPIYCDVIVQRWEEFTGEKAVLDG